MHAVARAPELYHAYIGVAQMGNQLKSEKRAYDYMLGRCRAERRTALARKLEAAPVTLQGGLPPAYVRVRDEAMHALGVGTMREMRSVVTGLFLPSLVPGTIRWRRRSTCGAGRLRRVSAACGRKCSPPIPARRARSCTCAEASAYFASLARRKGFYTFSRYSPMFEDPTGS